MECVESRSDEIEKNHRFVSYAISVINCAALLLLAVWMQPAAFAQSDSTLSITVDGDAISEEYFYYGSLFLLDSHERCSPVSDALLRERVVERNLLQQRYIEILKAIGDSQDLLDQYGTHGQTIIDLEKYIAEENPPIDQLNQLRYQIAIYHFPTSFSRFAESIHITAEQIKKEYNRLVSENHPLIHNFVAVRVKPVGAKTIDESKNIVEMFKSGEDIGAVRDALHFKPNRLLDGRRWIPVMPKHSAPLPDYNGTYWRDRFPNWNSDLQVGQVLGPYVHWLNQSMSTVQELVHDYYVVVDRVDVNKLPLTGLKNSPNFTYLWITRLLEKTMYDAMIEELRSNGEVRVNGEIVSSVVEFAGCADRTEDSVLFQKAMTINPAKLITYKSKNTDD